MRWRTTPYTQQVEHLRLGVGNDRVADVGLGPFPKHKQASFRARRDATVRLERAGEGRADDPGAVSGLR